MRTTMIGCLTLVAATLAMSLAVNLAVTLPAHGGEVYKWTDEQGVTHFTQQPPPAGRDFERVNMPGAARATGQDTAATSDSSGSSAGDTAANKDSRPSVQALKDADSTSEFDRVVQQENCRRAQHNVTLLDGSQPLSVTVTDDNGEEVTKTLSAEERSQRLEKARQRVQRFCGDES